MTWKYISKKPAQLKNWFYSKPKQKKKFKNFSEFSLWYEENVKDGYCYYCGISERDLQKLVHNGILKSKRFPFKGVIKRGVNRGYWLEIDRKNPNGNYSINNCVPCCYFCNNDKSDIFDHIQYKRFFQSRLKYFHNLK